MVVAVAGRKPRVLPDGRILCGTCGKTIAVWDEGRQCIIFELPRHHILVEIPGPAAVIQCNRTEYVDNRANYCGYVNRVRVGD